MTQRLHVQRQEWASGERLTVDCPRRGLRLEVNQCAACRYLCGMVTNQFGLAVLCSYSPSAALPATAQRR
jgi:hypothetical protein